MTLPSTSTTFPPDELALYDRQIRLWGIDAQARMRTAHVLIINLSALSNEIAKNLVLAGIGQLSVFDSHSVTLEDLGSQFLLSSADIGKNKAQAAAYSIRKLNPRVTVNVVTEPVLSLQSDFFSQFDIIIATHLNLDDLLHFSGITRNLGKPFYAASLYGLYAYTFADIIEHDYILEIQVPPVDKKAASTKKIEKRHESHVALAQALQSEFGKFLKNKTAAKVSPVLGCVLGILRSIIV
ncbi:DNA damage tolerance protein RHC31 [Neolecta irregularis DAH-3]|uniref:Ubiquitin-like 1-activating enzyme E1A n=1 Tax=Neolecta irregularis (strain DAH-3) TaxID=1198029 RepID=A0A1U7LI87_NEOID|nr:DNA damage tolerance protein RHC31 [Neolecta irregularis DAH-3]|eukprot:OLL22262.1 DNA damage tolerance protein RHC31 [Neolecta irregularis DAH-3]